MRAFILAFVVEPRRADAIYYFNQSRQMTLDLAQYAVLQAK
jgi:hypothetical protein